MIRLPQRSVTRFFIPLIDVLTLLFCIFLVLPLAKSPEDQAAPEAGRTSPEVKTQGPTPAEDARALQERLWVRVLEIDPKTGNLSYYYRGQRVDVRSQADARTLIEGDRREHPRRDLYCLILYPRTPSSYPTVGQVRQYQRWFEGVALGFDVPGVAPGEAKPS
jgi:hypothetical protein